MQQNQKRDDLNFIYLLASVFMYSSRPPMMSYAEKPEDITRDEWMEKLNNVHVQRADMNRLIMNYLVTGTHLFFLCSFAVYCSETLGPSTLTLVFTFPEGFKEAAEKFRLESGIEPSVDLDSLDERIKIREMILKGQIQEGIALINSLHPELLDTNRYLYFHLQVKKKKKKWEGTSCMCYRLLLKN